MHDTATTYRFRTAGKHCVSCITHAEAPRIVSTLTICGDAATLRRGARRGRTAWRLRVRVTSMTATPDSCLAIAPAPDASHRPSCRVVLAEAGGWEVHVEIDHRIVSIAHCADWHRVERLCAEIEGVERERHTESSARR